MTAMDEVDPVPGACMDAKFVDAGSDRSRVTDDAARDDEAAYGDIDSRTTPSVIEATEPLLIGVGPQDSHERTVF